MAKERQQSRFFQLRKDGRDALRKLTQEQKGLLLDIVFDYANAESEAERNDILEQEPDICVNIVASFLCADIRESERLYNEKCERNREIALNRERMRAERREATQQKPAEREEEAEAVPMDEADEEADEAEEAEADEPQQCDPETPETPEEADEVEECPTAPEESKAPQTKPVKAVAVPIEEAEYIDERSKEDILLNECWRNEQWQLTIAQYFQINKSQLEKYWNDFKIFCASGEKYHKDVRDLKAHFRDWINRKEHEYVNKNSNKQREREAEERKRNAVALMCKFIDEDSPSDVTAMGEHQRIFNGL